MHESRKGHGARKPWSEWSIAAKTGVIAAGVIVVACLAALCGAVTMWLWNWLMPYLFKLPEIGFWQAIGILLLSQLLFKGGHAGHAGRSHWKKHQVWKHMREDEEKMNATPL